MGAALLCVLAYLALCVAFASFQRKLIYFPPQCNPAEVEQYAASHSLERWRNSAGEPVGWKRLSPVQPAEGQVLVMHGNGGCAFQCAHYADAIQQAAPLDVFMVEYPGYESRPGGPSEAGLDAAADEGFALLATNRPILLLGESLGTGVATYLAGKHSNEVAGVVLLAPYNHLSAVGQAHFPFVPVTLFLRDRFPSDQYLRTYHGPVAILVADGDCVVPERFGRCLYDSYDGPKRLWEFPEGNHGTVMTQPSEIWTQIFDFWKSHSHAL
jgi:pimeloyl-ACP methyl ester carboxylesterase